MNGAAVELARLHAPLLIITAPLIGAALAALVPSPRASWIVAIVAALLMAVLAVDLATQHLLADAPFQGVAEAVTLRVDGVGAFAVALVAVACALTVIGAGAVLSTFDARVAPFVSVLVLCAGAGWAGALLAQSYTAVFLGVETAWLAEVGLTALSADRERGALNGALRMLGVGAVGSALMLVGIGLIGRSLGSWDVGALASVPTSSPGLASAGVGLVLLALAMKIGVAPLHVWLGAAYGRGGAFAPMALGAVGAIGALAVLLRVAAYAIAAPEVGSGVSAALVTLGAASVFIGSFQAIGATNVRRLAAYAGAAQAGCILLTAALGSPAAFAAALVQLFALCAASLALLGGAAVVGARAELNTLDGLARRAPLASVAMMTGALSLMGAPLTVGFLGRWRLIEAGVGAGWWWATGAVIAASLAAVFYAGRLIERIYFRRAGAAFEGSADVWRLALAPALIAAIIAVVLGLEPSVLLGAAGRAAALMLGEAS